MCFSIQWFELVLVWLVIIAAAIAILRLVLPMVLSALGPLGPLGNLIIGIVRILIWALLVIFCIYLAFDAISCLLGSGGLSLPRTR